MTSPIYWHPALYGLFMRSLYGGAFDRRYAAVAGLVGEDASLLDLCCGDCRLARHLPEGVSYTGLDNNPRFVAFARRRGLDVRLGDVMAGPWPEADVVVMMGSFYQFIPRQDLLLERMLRAARRRVIVCESVRHLATSPNPIVSFLGRRLSDPVGGRSVHRLGRAEMADLFRRYGASGTIDLGRDLVGVFDPPR